MKMKATEDRMRALGLLTPMSVLQLDVGVDRNQLPTTSNQQQTSNFGTGTGSGLLNAGCWLGCWCP